MLASCHQEQLIRRPRFRCRCACAALVRLCFYTSVCSWCSASCRGSGCSDPSLRTKPSPPPKLAGTSGMLKTLMPQLPYSTWPQSQLRERKHRDSLIAKAQKSPRRQASRFPSRIPATPLDCSSWTRLACSTSSNCWCRSRQQCQALPAPGRTLTP